nr:unnamed protein product [Callosobruchus chinensis]
MWSEVQVQKERLNPHQETLFITVGLAVRATSRGGRYGAIKNLFVKENPRLFAIYVRHNSVIVVV